MLKYISALTNNIILFHFYTKTKIIKKGEQEIGQWTKNKFQSPETLYILLNNILSEIDITTFTLVMLAL